MIDFNLLFARLGRIGRYLLYAEEYQADTEMSIIDLLGKYGPDDEDLTALVALNEQQLNRTQPSGLASQLRSLAASTLLRIVAADQPTRAGSVRDAISELIRQMRLYSESVADCTVTVASTAFAANLGDGNLLVSIYRGDGLIQQNIVPESPRISCVVDSRTGGATEGQETFQFVGVPNLANWWDWDWPQGSGRTAVFQAVTPKVDFPSGGNVLVNGSWDTWLDTKPSAWTADGSFTQELGLVYAGGAALRIPANTAPALYQIFNSTNGSTYSPGVSISLGVSFKIRTATVTPTTTSTTSTTTTTTSSATTTSTTTTTTTTGPSPSTGQIVVQLWNGSGVILDDQGLPSQIVQEIDEVFEPSGWATVTGVLRLPAVLPANVYLRIYIGEVCDVDVIVDHMAVTPLVAAYPGGFGLAVFSGASPWYATDGWGLTVQNNYAGATYKETFQALFDRLFDMKGLGLLLPYSNAPTISDTLITAVPTTTTTTTTTSTTTTTTTTV